MFFAATSLCSYARMRETVAIGAALHVGKQGLRRGHWSEVRYRGDPLRRPIASYEVPVLARLAVRASSAANVRLRLDTPMADDEAPPAGLVQVFSCPLTQLYASRSSHCNVNGKSIQHALICATYCTLTITHNSLCTDVFSTKIGTSRVLVQHDAWLILRECP